MQRRLAALLVADVVGYSRLMEADEAGTLAALRERRTAILEPVVRAHHGRIVKLMGDGTLIEFASAVKAVEAALQLQSKFAEANEGVSEDRRIRVRIGINLGDVVGERGDIYGDGVNVAARLESLAQPGGICISAKVHDEVRGKIGTPFEDIGEQKLKNIAVPVRAYVYGSGKGAVAAPVSDRPSIAVLPFKNMSGDPEQQYFSDGITEDIITELSRFRQMRVLARNSSLRYRGSDRDVISIGQELGVHYLVEGSVRKLGARIRIAAQLIDARSDHHLWAEKYDYNRDETFDVHDQVVRTIVGTLAGRLRAAGTEVAKRKPPASLAAYECVLRADALPVDDVAVRGEARLLCEKAISLDPEYARAYALLAIRLNSEWWRSARAPDDLLDRAVELARKSVALDENDSICQEALGIIYLSRRAYTLAEHHFQRALELNPNRPALISNVGGLYSYMGEPTKGIAYFKEARLLDPYFEPSWYWVELGVAHFIAHQYAEAVDALGQSATLSDWGHACLAACRACLGEIDEARRQAEETLRLAPDFSIAVVSTRVPLQRDADRQHLLDGMRKAGLPE
jgi:TolB-like protein